MTPIGGEISPGQDAGGSRPERTGGWGVPLGLLTILMLASVFRADVLIGVPLIALVLTHRTQPAALILAALFAGLVAIGSDMEPGLWHVQRAWALVVAGLFATVSLRWPGRSFVERGVTAVLGGFAGFGLAFVARPRLWQVIDWRLGERMSLAASEAITLFAQITGEPLSPERAGAVLEAVRMQSELFPAVLGLTTLAGLGLAWWMFGRWGRGMSRPLGPLKEFRFSDHLVWVLIAGLGTVLLAPGPGWERLGSNTLVFMGALYALRGAAVLLFVSGGVSVFGALVLAFAVLLLAPLVIAGMLVIGIGDTWLDLRDKARKTST